MSWSTHARPEKARAREYLFKDVPASKTSLWMPAAECRDILLALELGLLNQDSQIIAVERDPDVFKSMQKTLRRIMRRHQLRQPPITLNQPLHQVKLDQSIDFAFIDLCGTCDEHVLLWLELDLAPMLTMGAGVALTCTYALRNSKFLQESRIALVSGWRDLYHQFCGEHDYYDRHNDTREFEPIVLPAFLLKCAFYRLDVRMLHPWCYRDAMPMIAFRLCDIQSHPVEPRFPSFSNVALKMGKPVRRRIAKPAPPVIQPTAVVITLPTALTADDLAARRSAIARKAVETRRRNQKDNNASAI